MHDLTSATSALLMTTSAVPLSSAKVTADVSLTFRSAQTLPQLSELSLLGDRWATQERMFYGFCMFLRQNRTKSAKGKRKEQGKKNAWQLPWAMPLQCLRKGFLNLLRSVVDVVGNSQAELVGDQLWQFFGKLFELWARIQTTGTASSNNNKGPTLTK
jgi:hypothetical protein